MIGQIITRLVGKNVNLRLVEIDDAQFILDLRLEKGEFLSGINPNVDQQRDWIEAYKKRENDKVEYYFVIEDSNGLELGVVRAYDFVGNSFCWGSWIIKDGSPYYVAIESALLIYEFAFYVLGFKNCHFDVRRENESVLNFHKRFGAKIIKENNLDYFFKLSIDDYQIARTRYSKFLPLNNKNAPIS